MLSQNAMKHYLMTLLVLSSGAAYSYSCRQVLSLCFGKKKTSDVFLSLKPLNTSNRRSLAEETPFSLQVSALLYRRSVLWTPSSQGRCRDSLLIINKPLLQL